MDINLTKKFLSYFGNPLLKILKDNDKANGFSIANIYDIETILQINRENPYGVHFTPNGNLGTRNSRAGEEWKGNASKEHCENYISCLYTDFDLRATSFQTMSEFKEEVLNIIRSSGTKPHFFVQSGGGFHVYWLIEENDRKRIGTAYKDKYAAILSGIAEMLVHGEKGTHDISSNMRLPGTNHWKTGISKPTLIRTFDNDLNLQEFTMDWEPEWYITYNNIKVFVENDLNMKTEGQIVGKSLERNRILNDISIVDVINNLYNYPRTYKGVSYRYKYDPRNQSIYFETDNGTLRTGGYKVNIKDNYVHCFSFDKHDIKERPRGGVGIFLYYYFEQDWNAVNSFMRAEFAIDLTEDAGAGETYLTLEASNGKMFFTSNGVLYSYTLNKKEGPVQVDTWILKKPIIPKGVLKTHSAGSGETKNESMMFIMVNPDNGEEYTIEFCESQKRFNKLYGENGLIFFGNDMALLELFYTLGQGVKKGVIKEYNHMYISGWYKDYYIVGGKAYDSYGDILDPEENGMSFKDIEQINLIEGEDISIQEFASKLELLFSERVAILGYLGFLACLCGQKFWSQIRDNIDMFIAPAMFVSGRTRSGKSTLYNLIRRGFGIDLYRKISLGKGGGGTSAQPIKKQASDDFILHMEEFTGDIPVQIETLIRSIINQSVIETGRSDGQDARYILRSTVVIDGENLPESESVGNRFLLLPMFESDKKGTPELIEDIKKYSYFKDFISKLYSVNIEQLKEYVSMGKKELQGIGVSGRDLVIYGYVYVVNKIFLLLDDKELLGLIKQNKGVMTDVEGTYDELSRIISDLFSKYRIKPSTTVISDTMQHIHLMIPEDYKNKNKIILTGLMKKYMGKVTMSGNSMVIMISSTDSSDNNKELYNIVKRFEKYLETGRPVLD